VGIRSAALAAAARSSLTRAWPARTRLSVGALGLALVVLVSAAWGTGIFYLLARLGAGSPVRLAALDGVHAYVGLVGGVFVLAKVARVGLRHPVAGVPAVVPWQRWLSWSMLVLYGTVFLSGVIVLLPVRGRVFGNLVELHLLTSVWALLPTTWHVWHYRSRALPYLRRWTRRAAGRRFWSALALVALPAPLLVADGPAVSQLPQVSGGSRWTPIDALRGSYLDAIATSPDGRTLVAAGDALYLSQDGAVWVRVDLPAAGAAGPAAPADASHAGHEHGQPAPANAVTALAVGPDQVFAATSRGLFLGGFDGSLRHLASPSGAVRALAMDPGDSRTLWAASDAGPAVTVDGGQTWSVQAAELVHPRDVSAIAFLDESVYASDGSGVFRWQPAAHAWHRVSLQSSVSVLSGSPAEHALYASSLDDLQVLDRGGWTDLGQPAPVHRHGGHVLGEVPSVTAVAGRLYAAGTSQGVSASADGGWTWTQLGGGLGQATAGQVVRRRGSLWAATSDGLFRFPLAARSPATPTWWAVVLAVAIGVGLVAASVAAIEPRRRGARP